MVTLTTMTIMDTEETILILIMDITLATRIKATNTPNPTPANTEMKAENLMIRALTTETRITPLLKPIRVPTTTMPLPTPEKPETAIPPHPANLREKTTENPLLTIPTAIPTITEHMEAMEVKVIPMTHMVPDIPTRTKEVTMENRPVPNMEKKKEHTPTPT